MGTPKLECVNLAGIADELIKLHVVNDAETAAKVAAQIAEDTRHIAEASAQKVEPGAMIDIARECRDFVNADEIIHVRYKIITYGGENVVS